MCLCLQFRLNYNKYGRILVCWVKTVSLVELLGCQVTLPAGKRITLIKLLGSEVIFPIIKRIILLRR